jgi:hypothetical protein
LCRPSGLFSATITPGSCPGLLSSAPSGWQLCRVLIEIVELENMANFLCIEIGSAIRNMFGNFQESFLKLKQKGEQIHWQGDPIAGYWLAEIHNIDFAFSQ